MMRYKKERRRGLTLVVFAVFSLALLLPENNTICHAFRPTASPPSSSSSSLKAVTSTSGLPEFSPYTSISKKSFAATATTSTTRSTTDTSVELRTYQHDGWTLKYKYKSASPGYEKEAPLLLVHPVGIGMSSWFWDEFLEHYQGGPVYAPDLIGCGIDHGSDAWVPGERGLFFPLSWVQGCETLLQKIMAETNNNNNKLPAIFPFGNNYNNNKKKVTVVTQGGLAPVGVMLAYRNPSTISKLVMTSPPTWQDMMTPVPEQELESNYNFLKSKQGGWAFGALEKEWAIRFFSNLFLFEGKCDQKWLDRCSQECRHKEARPPIQAFNAGLMQHRSYQEELTTLPQETMVVQGQDDASRIPLRQEYETKMKNCQIITLARGKNVLPWECAKEFAGILQSKKKT